ncbi:MAG: hypothetical protein PXY39_07320 [archaeon]|nr:hypothetical protein [archaeon]
MNATRRITLIAIFTSLAIATDFAMAPIYNVKLVFTLVFASAYSFGFKIGAAIAVLTELIWGIISPSGFGGLIIPFLVGANIIYAVAGLGASKIWGYEIKPVSQLNIFFGSIMAICAFLWDTVTNFGTGIIEVWPHVTMTALLGAEAVGIPFMVFHELGDFVIGSALAPIIIVYFLKIFGERGHTESRKRAIVSGAGMPAANQGNVN